MWKVMAADDEAYIRDALKKLISWEKMRCVLQSVSCNGKELIDKIEDEHPDIVITDIRMPLMDGLEVCKYVYEKCPETQVILLSAYSDFEYARVAIRYNVCEYVLKVAVLEELPSAVDRAINNLEKQNRELAVEQISGGETKDTNSLYEQMVQYIEENYSKKITLDEMADTLHANRSYLSRLFKSRSGVNLFDYILQKRIEKAKEYMQSTNWKIYEISQAVGFDDTGYFSRVFKKYSGLSPKEYKNGRRIEDAQK